MNKLDAMRTLSNAYWHIRDTGDILEEGTFTALLLLDEKFHSVRRSLQSLVELEPQVNCKEGLNGRMPTFF